MVAFAIEADRAVIDGGAIATIPTGTLWAGILEVEALLTIEVLPGQTVIVELGADAFGAVVVGAWRAGDDNTTMAIPSLTEGTSRIPAGILTREPDEIRWALALVAEGVVDLIRETIGNIKAGVSGVPFTLRAHTFQLSCIPDATISADAGGNSTNAINEDFSTDADAF